MGIININLACVFCGFLLVCLVLTVLYIVFHIVLFVGFLHKIHVAKKTDSPFPDTDYLIESTNPIKLALLVINYIKLHIIKFINIIQIKK